MTENAIAPDEAESLDQTTEVFLAERAERIRELGRQMVGNIIDIGDALLEVRERLSHGEFLPWIAREFGWSERHARRFMEIARAFGKTANMSDLKPFQLDMVRVGMAALHILSQPEVPQAAREQAIQEASQGERLTQARARQLIGQHALPAPKMQKFTVEIEDVPRRPPAIIHTESETTRVVVPAFRRTPPGIESWDDLKTELQAIVDAVEHIEVPRLDRKQALEDRTMIMHAIGALQVIRDEVDAQVHSEDGDVAPEQ
jgi:hypothetical protein